MRTILILCLLGSMGFSKERPNIVFIFSDDHALNAISAYGGPLREIAPTPNLDRIAEQGAIFTRSYCSNSICGPSRAAILTGKHSHINGYLDNNNSSFDGSQTTFPKLLQESGYQTAIIGKWHLVSEPQGFDYWEILPGQGSYYNPDFLLQGGIKKRYEGYCTDLITDRAIEWLDSRDKSRPFLLMCQHKAPHRNWSPAPRHYNLFEEVEIPEPESLFDDYAGRSKTLKEQAMSIANDMQWQHDMKFHGENLFPESFTSGIKNGEYRRMTVAQKAVWDAAYESRNQEMIAKVKSGELEGDAITSWKYQRYIKDYLRCIKAVDENVGRVLEYLDENGLVENTIVIYSSDQGFYLGEHGWYDKRWMFEESLSMPFLVRWPGVVRPGSRSATMIQNIDYAPTFMEIAGVEIPKAVQGRSLLPVLKASGEKPADWREGIYYFYSGERTHRVAAHDGVRNERYKLMRFRGTDEWNLFDLQKDPHEMKSMHDDPDYAPVMNQMKELYGDLRREYHVNEATVPADRNEVNWWKARHLAKIREAAEGGHELVFIGDSIVQDFEYTGFQTWTKFYADRKALNLGFAGDRTEHVIWRLLNGGLKNVNPKVFVLMIGSNNTGYRQDSPEVTASGIRLILDLLADRKPDAKVLLLSVFPRDQKPDGPFRKINEDINKLIEPMADGERVFWLDLTDAFLDDDGTLPRSLMADGLHPNGKGYEIWAAGMESTLEEIMK